MDETQQKLERNVNKYDWKDVDEVADSLLVYQYNLESRSWKKLPNFWNKLYWKCELMETYIYDLCAQGNKLFIRAEGNLSCYGLCWIRPNDKNPEWMDLNDNLDEYDYEHAEATYEDENHRDYYWLEDREVKVYLQATRSIGIDNFLNLRYHK